MTSDKLKLVKKLMNDFDFNLAFDFGVNDAKDGQMPTLNSLHEGGDPWERILSTAYLDGFECGLWGPDMGIWRADTPKISE